MGLRSLPPLAGALAAVLRVVARVLTPGPACKRRLFSLPGRNSTSFLPSTQPGGRGPANREFFFFVIIFLLINYVWNLVLVWSPSCTDYSWINRYRGGLFCIFYRYIMFYYRKNLVIAFV